MAASKASPPGDGQVTSGGAVRTWSLVALDDDPDGVRLDRLVGAVQRGPASTVGPHDTLIALDWQHTSYRFAP
ncbi:DUF2716 domain-containing protein [Streptomyces sp. NPDC006551]|uniref:DUF2716 domain-containing protein n=1 Tax=Streptomyces sp. NPDC006551 TaxID=3157178 RepID=UPI0033A9FFF9